MYCIYLEIANMGLKWVPVQNTNPLKLTHFTPFFYSIPFYIYTPLFSGWDI